MHYFAVIFRRFLRGVLSTFGPLKTSPHLQLPLVGLIATDLCVRREIVTCKKLWTVGLSEYPPLICCLPKKLSSGYLGKASR